MLPRLSIYKFSKATQTQYIQNTQTLPFSIISNSVTLSTNVLIQKPKVIFDLYSVQYLKLISIEFTNQKKIFFNFITFSPCLTFTWLPIPATEICKLYTYKL